MLTAQPLLRPQMGDELWGLSQMCFRQCIYLHSSKMSQVVTIAAASSAAALTMQALPLHAQE